MAVREYWGRTRLVPVRPAEWVPAHPFRAHLLELVAVSDLSLDEVAALANVARQAARRLVHGRRDGRPVRKVHPDVARRLLRVRCEDVLALDRRLVPSALLIPALVDLLNVHGRLELVAARVGADPAELREVVLGAPTCTLRLVVRVRSAAEDLMANQLRTGLARPLHRAPAAA